MGDRAFFDIYLSGKPQLPLGRFSEFYVFGGSLRFGIFFL